MANILGMMQKLPPTLTQRLLQIATFCGVTLFVLFLFPMANAEEIFYPAIKARDGWATLPGNEPGRPIWSLEGQWEVYPGIIAQPSELDARDGLPRRLVTVPGALKQILSSRYQEDQHLATYRLHLGGLKAGTDYAILVKEAASAYRIFVQGRFLGGQGTVYVAKEGYEGRIGPRLFHFNAVTPTEVLVIQTADFDSSFGGLWQRVYFGEAQEVFGLFQRMSNRDLFFLASLIMLAVYQCILFVVMRRDRATLYLALFSLAIVVKSAFSEMQFGVQWVPWLPYVATMKLAYLVLALLPPLFMSYLKYCYPREVQRIYMKVTWILAAAEIFLVAVLSFEQIQRTFVWYQGVILFFCALILYQGIKVVIHRRSGGGIFLLGFVALIAAAVNDVLFSNLLIRTGYFLNVGLYLFLFTQTAITALRYRDALRLAADLSHNLEVKVEERTRELAQEKDAFERMAKEDSLTGLYNKRFLNEALEREFETYLRHGFPFSVLMIDLDWFKQVNDTWGHLCGDGLLARMGDTIKENMRKTDICGRFGGEEFLVVMRFTGLNEAMVAAEKLKAVVADTIFTVDGKKLQITISLGTASVSPGDHGAEDLVRRADDALYQAKASGRNCVRAG